MKTVITQTKITAATVNDTIPQRVRVIGRVTLYSNMNVYLVKWMTGFGIDGAIRQRVQSVPKGENLICGVGVTP